MALYDNDEQKQLFNLHIPRKSAVDCDKLRMHFPNFLNCENSYVLAEPTLEFNCIGWAIGVREFIDPAKGINKYYHNKISVGEINVRYGNGAQATFVLSNYIKRCFCMP